MDAFGAMAAVPRMAGLPVMTRAAIRERSPEAQIVRHVSVSSGYVAQVSGETFRESVLDPVSLALEQACVAGRACYGDAVSVDRVDGSNSPAADGEFVTINVWAF